MRGLVFVIGLCLLSLPLRAVPLQQAQPWLGVAVDEKGAGGVLVKNLLPDAPAIKAGLAPGDLITAVDDTRIKNREELLGVLRAKGVGNSVVVHFTRAGKTEQKTLKLEALPDRVELMQKTLMNKPVPEFHLTRIQDGKPISSEDAKGKVTILEFWATWCPACRSAIPRLNAWAKSHRSIQILSVSDEPVETVKAFMKQEKVEYALAFDKSEKIQGDFQVGSIPTFILIDSKGVVRDVAIGAGDYLESLMRKAEGL